LADRDNSGGDDPGGFTFLGAPEFSPDERVRSAYYFSTQQACLQSTMPAVGGQLVLRTKGETTLQFPDGQIAGAKAGECYFIAPTTQAAQTEILGPSHSVGLGFSELGWAELTGLPVEEVKNSIVLASDLFGDDVRRFAQEMLRQYAANDLTSSQIALEMRRFIEPRFTPLPERKRRLIQTVRAWATDELLPDVSELYASLHFSERQVQRHVKRYFGQSPVQVAKRLRAAFAASALNQGKLDDDLSVEIAESFYDQSHLIRDVKSTTGTTPSRIGKQEDVLISGILNSDGFLHDAGHVRKIGRQSDEMTTKQPTNPDARSDEG